MTLEDLWKIVRRYWTLILISVVVCTALSAVYVWTRTPVYTANATAVVVVGDSDQQGGSGAAYSNSLLAQVKAKGYVDLVNSTGVAERVVKDLKLQDSPNELAATLTAELTPDTPNIKVTATSDEPERAQEIANSVVRSTAAEAKSLEGKSSTVTIKLVSDADLPTRPSSPRPERILPFGALLGVLLGLGVAIVRRRQDTRLRAPEDVEAQIGASVLAVVPETKALAGGARQAAGEDSFQSREALRQLRTNLRFVDVDHRPRSIVVSSARMGEGKSTTSVNLARVLAESGENVMLVDADLRRPSVAGIFDLDASVGLTQVLAGTATLADAVQLAEHRNLSILTAGQIPPNPSELLGSHRMESLLDQLTETYLVILDAPPLLPVTDAALLTASADGALIVVRAGETREEQVARAVQNIRNVGGKVLGAVLNRVNTKRLNRIVYGESQYGYGAYGTYGGASYSSKKSGGDNEATPTAGPGAKKAGKKSATKADKKSAAKADKQVVKADPEPAAAPIPDRAVTVNPASKAVPPTTPAKQSPPPAPKAASPAGASQPRAAATEPESSDDTAPISVMSRRAYRHRHGK
ncbi:polysaccharide biosynthesis tyrosine autokinase [Demetria terragena]|uniref:polysaccharide biosynthesis tyrosine autokinase n=1 Tax=Demetria terragena TaxID=63959 RepID=UPI00037D6702|nr:polysaccharide biosynthesis tyrosine autokinase [Demetria terragena]